MKSKMEKFILKNLSTFSPSFLSAKYGVHQNIAINLCDKLESKYEYIKKYYSYECPKCEALNIESESLLENKSVTCESCHYHGKNFNIVMYFKNNKLFNDDY